MTKETTVTEETEVKHVEEIIEEKETVTTVTETEQKLEQKPEEKTEPVKAATEETKEEAKTEETPVKQAPSEVEKTDQTEEKKEESIEEKPTKKAEEKTETVVPEAATAPAAPVVPTPAVYAYKTAIATYTDAQALNFLRKKIYQYQEIDEGFLKKVAEDGAFTTEMKYISVVRCSADAQYSWKTKSGGETHDHNETKNFAKDFCDDVVELNPFDFAAAKTIELEKPREDEKMLAKKSYSVAKAKKTFNNVIKQASPNKKAKYVKTNERYETVYIPVLKTSCVFEGETYLGYVNLVNGACISEYKVSDRLQSAVNSTMGRVKAVKGILIHLLVFLALLCLMSLGKAFYHGFDKVNLPVLWTGVVIGALMLVPIFSIGVTKKYNPEKMKETAVHTGKMPAAKRTKLLVALSWLVCAAAVVVFFLKTVI